MSTGNWTLKKNLCRCCHAEGDFKNLAEPCFDSGNEEVFSNMIKDCFFINLLPVPGTLCTATYTICEACITTLRDAAKFRKTVVECEKKFKEFCNTNSIKVEIQVDIPVKEELQDSVQEDDFFWEEDNNEDNFEDDLSKCEYDEEEIKSDTEETAKKKPKKVQLKSTKIKTSPKVKKGRPKKMKEEPLPEEEEEPEKRKDYASETASYYTFDRAEDGSHNYTCTECSKVFKSYASVTQHYKHVHLRQRPKLRSCYSCEIRVPSHLRAFHLEKEHGIPAPTCGACGKKFAYPFQVLRHQKHDHMGEKMFACEVCNMKFKSQGNLSQHFIKHTASRTHKCEYCEKTFKWRKNLKTHILMHLDERRHVCSVCKEAFVQQTSLKYHMTKRHPEMI